MLAVDAFWGFGFGVQENGRIVKTGDLSLAKELEAGGYAAVRN